jgi:pfkB family carbohydrate kinase
MRATAYDYVAVGHVTRDLVEDAPAGGGPVCRPGGTAFYSALQAARLGLRTLIVTRGVPAQIEQLLAPHRGELDLHVIPATQTTTLATRGSGGARRQRVLAWAGAIAEPSAIVDARILHLAPVARETPARWRGRARFVGVTPQGLVRAWSDLERVPAAARGEIGPVALDRSLLPERFYAAVISEQERPHCRALFAAARECSAYVAVTAGSRPASVHAYADGDERVLRGAMPHAVAVRDELGAGDVFAAAFFVALAEGRDPLAATTFANAAAAVRIAAAGAGAIGSRARIEARID